MSTPVTPSPVQPDFPVQEGAQFSVGHLGPFDQLMHYRFSVPALGGRAVPGKVFLKDALQLTGVEVSYNCFPPGVGMPFLHAHQRHEEIYLFTSGKVNSWWTAKCFRLAKARWCAWRQRAHAPTVIQASSRCISLCCR